MPGICGGLVFGNLIYEESLDMSEGGEVGVMFLRVRRNGLWLGVGAFCRGGGKCGNALLLWLL